MGEEGQLNCLASIAREEATERLYRWCNYITIHDLTIYDDMCFIVHDVADHDILVWICYIHYTYTYIYIFFTIWYVYMKSDLWNKKCVILPKQRLTNRGTSIPDLLVLYILISTPGAGSGREEAQGLHHFQSSSMCRWGLRDSLHNWIPDNFLPTVYNRETMWRGLTCRVALERLEDANAHLRAKQKAMKDTMTAGLL